MKKILISTLSVLALTACQPAGTTYVTTGDAPMAKIQVSATGTTNMAPDMATVSAGVVTQGKTAREAMFGNATKMTRVFEELEGVKLGTAAILSSGYSCTRVQLYLYLFWCTTTTSTSSKFSRYLLEY